MKTSEARESVTWQKALEAWLEGNQVECEIDGTRHSFGTASNSQQFGKDMIGKGEWYILERGA